MIIEDFHNPCIIKIPYIINESHTLNITQDPCSWTPELRNWKIEKAYYRESSWIAKTSLKNGDPTTLKELMKLKTHLNLSQQLRFRMIRTTYWLSYTYTPLSVKSYTWGPF